MQYGIHINLSLYRLISNVCGRQDYDSRIDSPSKVIIHVFFTSPSTYALFALSYNFIGFTYNIQALSQCILFLSFMIIYHVFVKSICDKPLIACLYQLLMFK